MWNAEAHIHDFMAVWGLGEVAKENAPTNAHDKRSIGLGSVEYERGKHRINTYRATQYE